MTDYYTLFHRKTAARTLVFGCLLLCLLLGGCRKQESGLVMELEQAAGNSSVSGDAEELIYSEDKLKTAEGSYRDKADGSDKQDFLYVYVCGAVCEPGVVSLPVGSRADDAVKAAGGMTEEADTAYVNLAAMVADGEKVFIPTREEAEALNQEQASEENGLVNINKADAAQLCTLPGIGESRAADIIAHREKNGPFETIEDIMKVPGIKTSTFTKISDKITIK